MLRPRRHHKRWCSAPGGATKLKRKKRGDTGWKVHYGISIRARIREKGAAKCAARESEEAGVVAGCCNHVKEIEG